MSCANRGAMRRPLLPAAAATLALAFAAPSQALDYQLHGFLTQGFIYSNGNNFYGDSTDGSFEYYEAAVNGAVRPLPYLLFSAQVLARDAGAGDDGKPRLDYAFLDYSPWSSSGAELGLRLGRVKNPFGFYNDTRDVAFTRPGILLPSLYFETQGARGLLFSSDGAQAYAGAGLGNHYLSLTASYAPDRTLSEAEEERIGGDAGAFSQQGDISLNGLVFTRLHDEWGGWTGALSFGHGNLALDPNPGTPLAADLSFDLYQLSARYSAERYSVMAEYGITAASGVVTSPFGGETFDSKSDGIYVQADYFLNPAWTVMARYDGNFTDRNDRSGSECDSNGTPADRHQCFAHDFTTGLKWKHGAHWGAWAEYHWVDGTATVPAHDNQDRDVARHWSMLLLMGGYRF